MAYMIELDDIYDGLIGGEFFLEYQPIVSLDDGRCWGAEALIRWQRPAGVVMPSDFIPLVENSTVSGVLTYWVIERLAEDLGEWLRANADASICINVPPEILGRGGLDYASRKSGLRDLAGQIVLEVTETGLPDRLGLDALNSMNRRTGVRIALDDVTLGGANLAVLSRLNFDFIKIDRVLVEQIQGPESETDWLEGLSMLLRSTPWKVIAEGIETVEQFQRLEAAGVHLAQGFYFSRPVAAGPFKTFYAARSGQATE